MNITNNILEANLNDEKETSNADNRNIYTVEILKGTVK
jgi:hypothetical protein